MEAHLARLAGAPVRPGLGIVVTMRLLGMPPTGLALARRVARRVEAGSTFSEAPPRLGRLKATEEDDR